MIGKNCPDCGSKLGKDAYKCRCGWKLDAPQKSRHRDCAHAPACTKNATIREKTATGWAAFCEDHYIEYHHRASEKRVREELGLKTVEEMKEYCRRKLQTVFRSVQSGGTVIRREPGQDDEEKEAA